MVLYKTELILGVIITALGVVFLILFLIGGVLFTIGVLIPIIFLLTGVYLIYEAFTEVNIEEFK